jgi:hypothetical protein
MLTGNRWADIKLMGSRDIDWLPGDGLPKAPWVDHAGKTQWSVTRD